jgi:hypothetical protein
MLATDASNDGTLLGLEVVERDRRVRLEDIRRYVVTGSYGKKMDGRGRRKNGL